jgi:hypothetical protein
MCREDLTPGKALTEVLGIIKADVDLFVNNLNAMIISFVVRKSLLGDVAIILLISRFFSEIPSKISFFLKMESKHSIIKFWKEYLDTKDDVKFFEQVFADLVADDKLAKGLGVLIYDLASSIGMVSITGDDYLKVLDIVTPGFVANYSYNNHVDPHPDMWSLKGHGKGLYKIHGYAEFAFDFLPKFAFGSGC